MAITEQLTNDMKDAMRAKDKVALTTIRALKTAITTVEKNAGTTLTDTEVISIIRKQVKQRQDSITQFVQAAREELAENERLEIVVLEKYLPQALTEAEIQQIVTDSVTELSASGMGDMGKVMKLCQEKCAGRADGKLLSQAVKSSLNA